jgi:sporulation protein YlmC with PRC-barrel domain
MSGTATNETGDLIASDKVEGTAVYDRNGTKLGSVYNFMVEKRSGHVAYAVLSFGGFSAWEAAIIRCRGISSPMSPRRAAT